jgi:hypothetical protein
MAAGDQLHRLAGIEVAGDRRVVATVQAHDLGQHVRVTGITLRFRCGVPLPIARRRHRVDREHLVPGRDQRRDPRTTVGLDTDLDPSSRLTWLELGPLRRHRRSDQRV